MGLWLTHKEQQSLNRSAARALMHKSVLHPKGPVPKIPRRIWLEPIRRPMTARVDWVIPHMSFLYEV